jgi:adenosine deaminase
MRDLQSLPKGHLHLHLEGAMRPETLAELAAGYGIEVPPIRGYGSFTEFVGQYVAACKVIVEPDDLRRLTREIVEDAAAAGVVWVEPQFYPVNHRSGLASFGNDGDLIDLVIAEGRRVAAEHGISFGLMVSANRTSDPAEAEGLAVLAAERAGSGVVSFGLANDEVGFPPQPFEKAFTIAREAGLISAPHGGELEGPAWVYGALDSLGARRIGHGIRAIEEPELIARLVAEGICLDVCPTSNVMLSVVPDLAAHPLKQLLDAGVRCSINGDDPLLFGSSLLQEYEIARTVLGLDDTELAFVARCSIEDSGAPADLVAASVAAIESWLAD